jgi:hypothetical protein
MRIITMKTRQLTMLAAILTALLAGSAQAALPKPTPAAQQAAAAKKAQADAQAAKDKEALTASMDAVSARWRSHASQQGWKTHPPVAIAAAPAPGAAIAAAPTAAPAATPAAAPGGSSAPITGAAPAGQPAGQLTPAGAALAIKSEKFGTAPPSEDVKKTPTVAEPKNAKPTVRKGSTPEDVSKK